MQSLLIIYLTNINNFAPDIHYILYEFADASGMEINRNCAD